MVFLRNELRHYQSSTVQHLTFSVGYSVMLHCCRKVIGYNLQYNRDVRYQIISHIEFVGSRSTCVTYSSAELKSALVYFLSIYSPVSPFMALTLVDLNIRLIANSNFKKCCCAC